MRRRVGSLKKAGEVWVNGCGERIRHLGRQILHGARTKQFGRALFLRGFRDGADLHASLGSSDWDSAFSASRLAIGVPPPYTSAVPTARPWTRTLPHSCHSLFMFHQGFCSLHCVREGQCSKCCVKAARDGGHCSPSELGCPRSAEAPGAQWPGWGTRGGSHPASSQPQPNQLSSSLLSFGSGHKIFAGKTAKYFRTSLS